MLPEQVLVQLSEETVATGKTEGFTRLQQFLCDAESSMLYADLSTRMNWTEGVAHADVHHFHQRYRELLRTTVADPKYVKDELRRPISVISC